MPLEKGQRVLPTVSGPASASTDPALRPMTTKQARKEYLERTRGPKLTKEEQRAETRRLQAEIRRDIKKRNEEAKKAEERERTQIRAKAARDRAKAKEEAEKAAKRKAGKPLKPPRPSQASILGFMRGNATAKKRAPAEEDTKLAVISEESEPPASSAGSSTKRRRLSGSEATVDCPGPEDNKPEGNTHEVDVVPPDENTEPLDTEITAPLLALDDSASPEVQHDQGPDLDPPPSGQAEAEAEPHTASSSPTPVSSPWADHKARVMDPAISFSLDDFEDALASAADLDDELLEPDNTPIGDQADEDSRPAIAEALYPARSEGKPVAKPAPDFMNMLPFLSTQDCSLSEADLDEIETPLNHGQRRRTWNSATPVPRRPLTTLSRSTLHRPQSVPRQHPVSHTPTRQPWPNPSRPPLAPITNPRILAPNTNAGSPTKVASSSKTSPGKVSRAAKLTDEDLSALQSEDWDDDLSLGKAPSPRPARSSAANISRPGQAMAPPCLGPSSSDIRSLALADWSDDL